MDRQDHSLSDFCGTLALVGAGKMGGAMLQGWLALGLDPARVLVLDPQPPEEIAVLAARGLRLNPTDLPAAHVIVLAVKPQVAATVLPTLRPLLGAGALVLSIMAGRTLRTMADALGGHVAMVRAMPNTPAAIGRGITVAVPNAAVSSEQRDFADRLLGATGGVEWVDDETLLDAVTAVSGSGPAYVFLLAESLARAGIAAGLPPALARRLARDTVAGSGELLHRSAADASMLRQNVTSPGGTTAAALEVLMAADGLDPLLQKAVAAATARSRALAG